MTEKELQEIATYRLMEPHERAIALAQRKVLHSIGTVVPVIHRVMFT